MKESNIYSRLLVSFDRKCNIFFPSILSSLAGPSYTVQAFGCVRCTSQRGASSSSSSRPAVRTIKLDCQLFCIWTIERREKKSAAKGRTRRSSSSFILFFLLPLPTATDCLKTVLSWRLTLYPLRPFCECLHVCVCVCVWSGTRLPWRIKC